MKKNEEKYSILDSDTKNPNIFIKKISRNYGIDLARIISMLLIINHHIIYHGGPLSKTQKFSIKHKVFVFLNVICVSGVNIFGLISGCIGFHSYKFPKLFYLLFTTFFYNIIIIHLFKAFKPKLEDDSYHSIYTFFIIDYWYFTAYFSIYIFFPLINEGITQIKEITMRHFSINLFLVFSFLNEIMKNTQRFKSLDIFNLKNGFSFPWLLILYLIGSYLGKFKIDIHKKRNKYYYIKFIFMIIILGLIKTKLLLNEIVKYNKKTIKLNYASPTYLGISISIIMLFSNTNIKNKKLIKIISFFSPLIYGIYLLHNHSLVRKYMIKKYFLWILQYKPINTVIVELICSFGIFIICGFIDYIRILIFRLINLQKLFILLEYNITIIADKICLFNL